MKKGYKNKKTELEPEKQFNINIAKHQKKQAKLKKDLRQKAGDGIIDELALIEEMIDQSIGIHKKKSVIDKEKKVEAARLKREMGIMT